MSQKETTKLLLKEAYQHGTALIPLSLHHTTIPAGQKSVLYLHWHDEFEFLVIQKGGAIFSIENVTYELYENEAIFINSNQLHSAKVLNDMPCDFYAVVFHPAFLFGNIHNVPFNQYIKPILTNAVSFPNHLSDKEDYQQKMILLIKEITFLFSENINDYELFIKGKILELWHLLFYHSKSEHFPSKEYKMDRLRPVLDFIELHYQEDITLQDMAVLIPLSQGQFSRSFRETIGISPITYLTRCRILKSCELLSNGNKKIAEIASLTGFSNVSYYNRAFLSIIGCTPTSYRRSFFKYGSVTTSS